MKYFISIVIITLSFFNTLLAQCAMCKGAAETSLEAGNTQAASINTGILYVIFIVFSILGICTFLVWKYRNSNEIYQ